ncbi:hypothetical protein NUACC21_20220 [Scytonema sp. NUACC21]
MAQPKELLADRYLVISKAILLDTKPGFPPQTLDVESLPAVRPYLRLFPYRLYVPQVYGVIHINEGTTNGEILLLEKPPLRSENTVCWDVQLERELIAAWQHTNSMRQLNWLWQIAHLWQPLAGEGVACSLLTPEVLRVEGPLVRLLELRYDKQSPSLTELGEFWQQQLCQKAQPAVAKFISEVCRSLISQEIRSGEQLIAVLDKGLAEVGKWQKPRIKIATKSDIGPNRPRNEDACYPPSGSLIGKPPQQTALAIVCDGIGGHEGGSVASNLAIDTIQQQIQELVNIPPDHINPLTLLDDLERATAVANDKISQRNDSEHRHGRQRMGTTLVMALPVAHEMYIAHVGDSRAYWITRYGCYQVTLDDDVASREVRLGYATYRDAVQQGASGSLVQALGMSASSSLHPTSQRFILDEDCVFLLCSDGLSDFDRVEQYWETEILPILTGNADIATVTNKLVEIANNQNGHDNVTIALVHCQVQYTEPKSDITPVADVSVLGATSRLTTPPLEISNPERKTEVSSSNKEQNAFNLPLQLIIIPILLSVAALVGLAFQQGWFPVVVEKLASLLAPISPPPSVSVPDNPENSPQTERRVIRTDRQEFFSTVASATSPASDIKVPPDSILQETTQPKSEAANESATQNSSWVYLRVCLVGKTSTQPATSPNNSGSTPSNNQFPQQGQIVKIEVSKYKKLNIPSANDTQKKQCQPQLEPKADPSVNRPSTETEPPVSTSSVESSATEGANTSSG